jgi:copper(I)-binding protein
MRTVTRRIATVAGTLLAIALVAGCSGAATPSSPGIGITGAWARPSTAMAAAEAAYMVITNPGSTPDALTGVTSAVARTAELHETYVVSPAPSASGMGSGSGMMGMRPIPRLEIPANGTVELKPGSYHIMLIGLTKDLAVGEKIDLTLTFEKAGSVKVQAEVRGS